MKLKNREYVGKENVYDIQIVDTKNEDEHNFLLSNGLVSHNSELMNLRNCRYDDGIKVYADYANNEVRVLAGITKEDVMIDMFKGGGDFHRMNAANILKKAPEFISDGERRFCKMSCIAGEMRIPTLDGQNRTIKELAENFDPNKPYWVYSYNQTTGGYVPGKVIACAETKKVKKLIRTHFKGGGYVDTTPDHKFCMREEDTVRNIDKLKGGESILSMYRGYTDITYKSGVHNEPCNDKDYEVIYTKNNVCEFTHRIVSESLKDNEVEFRKDKSDTDIYCVHHKDTNKLNNNPDNLVILSRSNHIKEHTKIRSDLYRNDNVNLYGDFLEWDETRRKTISDMMKIDNSDWKTSRGRKGLLGKCILVIKRLRHFNIDVTASNYNKYRYDYFTTTWDKIPEVFEMTHEEFVNTADHYPISEDYDYGELKELDTSIAHDNGVSHMDYLWNSDNEDAVKFREQHSIKQSKMLTESNYDEEFQNRAKFGRFMKDIKKVIEYADNHNIILTAENYEEIRDKTREFFELKKGHNLVGLNKILEYKDNFDEVIEEARHYNHEVDYIEVLEFDEEVPVYDLTVEKWHNYAMLVKRENSDNNELCNFKVNETVFSFQTFAILYGATVYKVARDFMNGDLDSARDIFNGFFSKYKKIHKFIQDKHYEGITTGRVTTAFGDYIDVQMPAEISKLTKEQINAIVYEDKLYDYDALVFDEYDRENDRRIRGNIAKGLRNSQNYPIQSWASSNAGYRMKQLSDYMRDINTSFRIDSFTHDSFTGDIKLIHLPVFIRDWKKFIVESTHKEFNVPVDADIEIGVMGDELLEIKKSEVSDDLKIVKLRNVSGTLNAWELLKSKFEEYGVEIKDFELLKKKVKTVSQDELFTTRRAFSMSIGKPTEMVELNVDLDFSNVKMKIFN